MRPRVFPAEDRGDCEADREAAHCFNEAAGIPRGRRADEQGRARPPVASMRPRVFPAEDDEQYAIHHNLQTASMRPRVFPAEDDRGARHEEG